MNVVMIGLPTRAAGLAAMDRIDWAVDEGRISVDDVAIERVEVLGSADNAITLESCSGRVAACSLTGARSAGLWSISSVSRPR